MRITDFTNDKRVATAIDELEARWDRKQVKISDIVDEAGNQYVDLVLEGGGVLGIALVGYTYALESVGIRFLGVGGTSAGAINAMLVAALDTPDKPKSQKLLKALAELEMFEFVDGDGDARDFVECLVERAGVVKMLWKGWQVMDNMNEDLGLNPGDAFLEWLTKQLHKAGIDTVAQLEKRMLPPVLYTRDGKKLPKKATGAKLAVVAAELCTETKVVFPEMAGLFWSKPRTQNPAMFVRASMSIPGFFHPMRVAQVPQGDEAAKRWDDMAGYTGVLPREVLFVDGGIMSNFPIDLFHSKEVPPLAPTLGAKLGVDRTRPKEVEKPLQLLGALFNSARHCADYSFLIRNPDYRQLVTFIQTGNHNWLDFFLTPEAKIDLFAKGVTAAVEFLSRFDWEKYKGTRTQLSVP